MMKRTAFPSIKSSHVVAAEASPASTYRHGEQRRKLFEKERQTPSAHYQQREDRGTHPRGEECELHVTSTAWIRTRSSSTAAGGYRQGRADGGARPDEGCGSSVCCRRRMILRCLLSA